ncbi:MAG: threonine synthase [candidate division WS6 bacterium OLB20]|uniref:Threonine synthase n=1 Tax=candidate division WS6 bacterium OLB20 TaxID=1617426 RepID=A0A136M0Q7_9BACT|nr:MAG: threonine synthase [candidate division WS6 bacterium OLB20]
MWNRDPVSDLPVEYRYTSPGDTTLTVLETNEGTIHLKNEHENPTGSFKDRSLAYQIGFHIRSGQERFVISSSGNAAIAAAAVCTAAGAELDIFCVRDNCGAQNG